MPVFEEVRTITANGRLVIPWVIQLALGLEHGGPVRFRVENGVVTLAAADPRKAEVTARASASQAGAGPEIRAESKSALIAELKLLQAIAERDGSAGPGL